MTYYLLEPEVAGGLGEHTIMDRRVHPPIISRLHYHFDGWLGDAILETFPSFIVTQKAQEALLAEGISGIAFDRVEISVSDAFQELYPGRQLPKFVWLKPEGKVGHEDVGTVEDGRLVVSQRALDVLSGLGISNALATPYEVER
ncbi:MAG: hypothetical protein ABL889_11830 [Terricaulis sp.]